METKEYKNGHYRFDEGSKMKQIIDDIRYEIIREEILKEMEPLDNDLLEKISSLAYFEEFISGDLLEKAWKIPWGWGKKEDFARNWFYIPHLFGEYERVELLERTYADTALIFTENNGKKCPDDCFKEAFESNKTEMTWNLRNKMYCPKDWRDFK